MKPEPNVYVVYPKVMIKYCKQRSHYMEHPCLCISHKDLKNHQSQPALL